MKLTEEMMGEAMDEAMEDDEMEEEAVVSQVLDEIGVEMNMDMAAAPTGNIVGAKAQAAPAQPQAVAEGQQEDLQSRLDALRR